MLLKIFGRKKRKSDLSSWERIFKSFRTHNKKARRVNNTLNNINNIGSILHNAEKKALKKHGPIDELIGKIRLIISLIKDYISGKYTRVPVGTITTAIIGLIYFITPIDAVLDFIPFAGLVDDAGVLAFVISQINTDLNKYKIWKALENGDSDHENK